MRALLLITALWLLLPFGTLAEKRTTQFLGIPIDGLKKDFVTKLKERGFKHHTTGNYFTGYFNGYPVYIFVESHDHIVNRVTVYDIPQLGENGIRKRFNYLCEQFEKSHRYTNVQKTDPRISQRVSIQREMKLNGRVFKAVYHQIRDIKEDALEIRMNMQDATAVNAIDSIYPLESLRERRRRIHVQALKFVTSPYQGPHNSIVWMSISEKLGKYAIVLVFENLKNRKRPML